MPVDNLITKHIDIWTSAVQTKSTAGRGTSSKLDLYGIKKLRELILELAVRGKLVPQDPNDEPASVLLDQIEKEKAKLVKDKKIKKGKPFLKIQENELPFSIPNSWTWARLGELGLTQTGGTPKKSVPEYFGSDIPFIKPADIMESGVVYDNEALSFEGATSLGRLATAGSVLMVCIGTIGKCQLINRECAFNQQINSISPYLPIGAYLFNVLKSRYFERIAWNMSSSTTIAILNKGKWESIPVPVAPKEEQNRIVAKVDELMVLCDQLEQQTETSIEAHQVLVETLLATLTNSANADELMENWQHISAHFDTLFTTEESIDQLKQTILQLAVMGKLVPQDPKDEPASVLLERIAEEKAQLVKDKKIKKQKALTPIADDEKPFEVPDGWEWCRLGDACKKLTDGSHNPPPNHEGGFPMLSCKEIYDGRIDFSLASRFVDQSGYEKENKRTAIKSGDVLLNIVASIGRSAIVPETFPPFVLQRNVAVLDSKIESKFLTEFLMSPMALDYYDKNAKGTAQKVIYLGKLSEMLIPVPPLSEQGRIVSQLNEVMGICDQFKVRLKNSQITQLQFTDAIVEQAL